MKWKWHAGKKQSCDDNGTSPAKSESKAMQASLEPMAVQAQFFPTYGKKIHTTFCAHSFFD